MTNTTFKVTAKATYSSPVLTPAGALLVPELHAPAVDRFGTERYNCGLGWLTDEACCEGNNETLYRGFHEAVIGISVAAFTMGRDEAIKALAAGEITSPIKPGKDGEGLSLFAAAKRTAKGTISVPACYDRSPGREPRQVTDPTEIQRVFDQFSKCVLKVELIATAVQGVKRVTVKLLGVIRVADADPYEPAQSRVSDDDVAAIPAFTNPPAATPPPAPAPAPVPVNLPQQAAQPPVAPPVAQVPTVPYQPAPAPAQPAPVPVHPPAQPTQQEGWGQPAQHDGWGQ